MSTADGESSTAVHQLLSETMVATCRGRQQRLRAMLSERAIDAALISNPVDIRYLTGFIGHDSLLLVHAEDSAIISDPRYDEFLDPWRGAGLGEVVMGIRHRLADSVRTLCEQNNISRLALQQEHATLAFRDQVAATVGDERITAVSGLLGVLRMRKDATEIAAIEQAIAIQQAALEAAIARLRSGMTERQFCAVIEFEMMWRGATGPSFDPIVATGANSSVIHYLTGAQPIEPGVLLIDWGAKVDGHSSDMTRTFGVGHMPEKVREIYPVVQEAQAAAIDACRPGRVCAEIDEVARSIIRQAGHGDHFGHGLGHGLGMDTHEGPYFNNLQTDVELEPGMVMTVEPGIYLPGIGGVRIEDDVLITDQGARVLSSWPKDLEAAMIDFAADSSESIAVAGEASSSPPRRGTHT